MKKPEFPDTPTPDDRNSMDSATDSERRRFGRITRDDRGQAIVDWVKPPKDWQRTELSLVDEPAGRAAGGHTAGSGYDPYESSGGTARSGTWNARPSQLTRPARTDLRKLSEHIKQMRALKDRKDAK